MLTVRGYGPLGFHGAGITPKQRFLDSIGNIRVAENLLNARVALRIRMNFPDHFSGAFFTPQRTLVGAGCRSGVRDARVALQQQPEQWCRPH
ncbi:hypothetical protein QWJ07_33530 [Frankia sp. RB7]|nr:hypothetical protein [Frankia sp. RB7]